MNFKADPLGWLASSDPENFGDKSELANQGMEESPSPAGGERQMVEHDFLPGELRVGENASNSIPVYRLITVGWYQQGAWEGAGNVAKK